MNTSNTIAKPTGVLAILSGIVALLSYFLVIAAVNFDFEVFANPAAMLTMQHVDVSLLRWSMITDIIGYYLLLLPAIFYLNDWMSDKTAWAKLLTFCGSSYVLVGSIGAAILAVVWPALITEHASASAAQQESITVSFRVVNDFVYGGLWNLLAMLFGGIWWLGVGAWLRPENKVFGFVTIGLGAFTLLDGVGGILDARALSELGLNVYLILAPVWAIWYGIILAKRQRT
jgi:hypothetical protein